MSVSSIISVYFELNCSLNVGLIFRDHYSFRNLTYGRLLLASDDEYDDRRFYNDDAVVTLSKLELDKVRLKKLSQRSLNAEFRRRLGSATPRLDLMVAAAYRQHPRSYDFLEYVCRELLFESDRPLKKRLRYWQRRFEDEHDLTFRQRLDAFKNWLMISTKEINGLKLAITLFIAAVAGLFGVTSGAFSALWNLLKPLFGG